MTQKEKVVRDVKCSVRFASDGRAFYKKILITGLFMLLLSSQIDALLGEGTDHTPNVAFITFIFFMLNFLAATQDIAVDGWALTILSRYSTVVFVAYFGFRVLLCVWVKLVYVVTDDFVFDGEAVYDRTTE